MPREALFPRGEAPVRGFVPGGGAPYLERILREGRFVPRPGAEGDPSLKQVIPYGVVARGGEVFLMRRTRRGEETRLHDRFSLGVGGHVNPRDAAEPTGDETRATRKGALAETLIERALLREVAEELVAEGPVSFEVAGVLNDDSDPVGEVHFGVVYRLEAAGAVRVREVSLLEGSWVPADRLDRWHEAMESWSRLLAASLGSGRPSAAPPAGPARGARV